MIKNKVIFSGAKPSGILTLGNYIGALKNWVELAKEYECIFSVVDLHALTVRQDPKELRQNCLDALAQYIAVGLDPEKSLVFIQSHVPAHAELAWILNCYTYIGELGRMTQFKDKSAKYKDNINAGLYDYPVLMAADILLYQTELVPVGEDQKQHLELSRDIAIRFNGVYGDVFKVPEAFIPKHGARIMGIQDPTKKMSKTDENELNYITLTDSPDKILKKLKRAVTDSGSEVKFGEGKDGINNLLNIYASLTDKSIEEVEAIFEGKGYGDFKKGVAEVIIESLRPIREKFEKLSKEPDYLRGIYVKGAQRATEISGKTIKKVYSSVGLVLKDSF